MEMSKRAGRRVYQVLAGMVIVGLLGEVQAADPVQSSATDQHAAPMPKGVPHKADKHHRHARHWGGMAQESLISLRYAQVGNVGETLKKLSIKVSVSSDEASNVLVVRGDATSVRMAKEIAFRMDADASAHQTWIALRYLSAHAVRDAIGNLYPHREACVSSQGVVCVRVFGSDVFVSEDTATNSLLLSGPVKSVEEVKNTVSGLEASAAKQTETAASRWATLRYPSWVEFR